MPVFFYDLSTDYVSKRLGHQNTRTTLDVYAHMLEEKSDEQDALSLEFLSLNVPKQ